LGRVGSAAAIGSASGELPYADRLLASSYFHCRLYSGSSLSYSPGEDENTGNNDDGEKKRKVEKKRRGEEEEWLCER